MDGPFYPGLVSTDRATELWHARTKIPLLAWSSQARGFFTDRYSPKATSGKEQDAFTANMIRVYHTKENLERLHRAQELGERKGGYSAVQIALAWVMHRPFQLITIVGPHTQDELKSCVEALSIKLTAEECDWLDLRC